MEYKMNLRKLIVISLLLQVSSFSYAHDRYEEFVKSYRATLTQHYSISNRIVPIDPKKPAPCNYANVPAQVDCYYTENQAMLHFFKGVPAKLKAKGVSRAKITTFKRQQAAFERRAKRYCDRQNELYYLEYQGSGNAMAYQGCFYRQYHPRFLKLKRMLGESHPVRSKRNQ